MLLTVHVLDVWNLDTDTVADGNWNLGRSGSSLQKKKQSMTYSGLKESDELLLFIGMILVEIKTCTYSGES